MSRLDNMLKSTRGVSLLLANDLLVIIYHATAACCDNTAAIKDGKNQYFTSDGSTEHDEIPEDEIKIPYAWLSKRRPSKLRHSLFTLCDASPADDRSKLNSDRFG